MILYRVMHNTTQRGPYRAFAEIDYGHATNRPVPNLDKGLIKACNNDIDMLVQQWCMSGSFAFPSKKAISKWFNYNELYWLATNDFVVAVFDAKEYIHSSKQAIFRPDTAKIIDYIHLGAFL